MGDNQIRMSSLTMVGRMASAPIPMNNGECYFKMSSDGEYSFPCFCDGKTAENMIKYLNDGDEISIEGKPQMIKFRGEAQPKMLVFARFISYGRKNNSMVSSS